jgi:hypothetical protein
MTILNTLQKHHASRIELLSEQELSFMRDAAVKLADCPAILQSLSKNLEPYYKEQFERQHQVIHDFAHAIASLAGLAISSLLVKGIALPAPQHIAQPDDNEEIIVPGSPPTQSQNSASQTSDDWPITYRGYTEYFENFFSGLTADSEKAAFLAKDRLNTVSPVNSPIALLQLEKLRIGISVYSESCRKYVESLAGISKRAAMIFATVIRAFSVRIDAALAAIDNAYSLVSKIPRPPTAQNPKTPNKTRAKKLPAPLLNPTQLLQQRTMDAFLLRVSKTAAKLNTIVDGHAIITIDERFVRLMDAADDPTLEERLHSDLIKARSLRSSAASRYMAEAHNRFSTGNDDSNDSTAGSPERNSDLEFLASQASQISDDTLPRYIQARSAISKAGQLVVMPDIVSLTSVRHLPPGFCTLGHAINKRVVKLTRKGKTVQCSFCNSSPAKTTLYTCAKSDSFACFSCLENAETFPPPPKCPIEDCDGTCTLRFLPSISALCCNGHEIPADNHFWMCTKASCKTRLCVQCAPTAPAPHSNPDASQNNNDNSPSPSSSCSPILNSNTNGPGAPMRPSLGH